MNSIETEQYRKFVDLLYLHGASEVVSLPQIAVVGDQSSGKSSVLTALAGIFEFPSSSTITTRCPTQVIMNRGKKETAKVSSSSTEIKSVHLEGPKGVVKAIEAIQRQLVPGNSNKSISKHNIIIELTGPDLPEITLIDLPGLIRTVTDSQEESDMVDVRNISESYMKATRTIVLAVVSGNVDLQTSEIIQMARKNDPGFQRTVMVITKPDLIEPGTEKNLIQQASMLNIPYHIVRCRGQNEREILCSANEMIHKEKSFFSSNEVWVSVDSTKLGVEELKKRLSDLLYLRIKEELPKVKVELEEKLKESKENLEKMGIDCSSDLLRRVEFTRVLAEMNTLIHNMIYGVYTDSFFLENIRLCSKIRELCQIYNQTILGLNSTWEGKTSGLYYSGDRVFTPENGGTWGTVKNRVGEGEILDWFIEFENGTTKPFASVDLSKFPSYLPKIIKRIQSYRGPELYGFISWNLVCNLITEAVEEWRQPSQKLLDYSYGILTCAVYRVVDSLNAPSQSLSDYLKVNTKQLLEKSKKKAVDSLAQLLKAESNPATENYYYYEILKKRRNERLIKGIESMKETVPNSVNKKEVLLLVQESLGMNSDTNEIGEAEELLIVMNSYLKVAKKRFIDNVCQIITMEMRGFDEALSSFLQLTDADLARLMSESYEIKERRKNLQSQVETCSVALEDFKKFSY